LPLRVEPDRIERIAGALEIVEHLEEVGPDEVLEHETVVQRSTPAHQCAVERHPPEPGDECPQQ
jgi:hypothetical protein